MKITENNVDDKIIMQNVNSENADPSRNALGASKSESMLPQLSNKRTNEQAAISIAEQEKRQHLGEQLASNESEAEKLASDRRNNGA